MLYILPIILFSNSNKAYPLFSRKTPIILIKIAKGEFVTSRNSGQICRTNVKRALPYSLSYVAIQDPKIAAVEQTLSCC